MNDEAKLEQIYLTLHTQSKLIYGFISVPHDLRVSDFLNDRLSPFLELSNAIVPYYDGTQEKFPRLHMAKSTIDIVEATDPVTGTVPQSRRNPHLVTRKSPVSVRVQLPGYIVRGNVHLIEGKTISDMLNSEAMLFIPLTDANVQLEGSERLLSVKFVAINTNQISWVYER